ncbi:MAG: hypothetical protein WD711_03895, partial [Dongiaceae bacterium]
TPAGREFEPIVEALGIWGQRWSRRTLEKHEVNVPLLMWALEQHVKPGAFGARRCVVKLTFTDQPAATRDWWFVNESRSTELCFEAPGFEEDMFLVTTLADMIFIYRGDMTLAHAIECGRLEAHGSAWARRALGRWLQPSPIAHVKSQRSDEMAA